MWIGLAGRRVFVRCNPAGVPRTILRALQERIRPVGSWRMPYEFVRVVSVSTASWMAEDVGPWRKSVLVHVYKFEVAANRIGGYRDATARGQSEGSWILDAHRPRAIATSGRLVWQTGR